MKFLQSRRERNARAAVRIGEDQQEAFPSKLLQRQFTSVQAWQTKIRRGSAGFQPVPFDLAADERALAETIGAITARGHPVD